MNQQKLPQLFSLTQICIGTFLGSGLAAGYMLAKNYSALGQPRNGVYVIIGSAIITLCITLIPANPLTDPGIAVMVTIGQVLTVLLIANALQGKMLASFREMGGTYQSMLRTVMVGFVASFVLLFLYIMIAPILGIPLPEPPPVDG